MRKKGNDHQLIEPLIVKKILHVSTLGNVQKKVWRTPIFMLGYILNLMCVKLS